MNIHRGCPQMARISNLRYVSTAMASVAYLRDFNVTLTCALFTRDRDQCLIPESRAPTATPRSRSPPRKRRIPRSQRSPGFGHTPAIQLTDRHSSMWPIARSVTVEQLRIQYSFQKYTVLPQILRRGKLYYDLAISTRSPTETENRVWFFAPNCIPRDPIGRWGPAPLRSRRGPVASITKISSSVVHLTSPSPHLAFIEAMSGGNPRPQTYSYVGGVSTLIHFTGKRSVFPHQGGTMSYLGLAETLAALNSLPLMAYRASCVIDMALSLQARERSQCMTVSETWHRCES